MFTPNINCDVAQQDYKDRLQRAAQQAYLQALLDRMPSVEAETHVEQPSGVGERMMGWVRLHLRLRSRSEIGYARRPRVV